MNKILKTLLSLFVIILFSYLAYINLTNSLIEDKYVYTLKESIMNSPHVNENTFFGLKTKIIGPKETELKNYNNQSSIYVFQTYETHECRKTGEDRECRWWFEKYGINETIKFSILLNNKSTSINNFSKDIEYIIKKEIFLINNNRRIIEYSIPLDSQIHIWGQLENNTINSYNFQNKFDKTTFIITNDAKYTLSNIANKALLLQSFFGILIIIMLICLFFINKDNKFKYFKGTNLRSGNLGSSPNSPQMIDPKIQKTLLLVIIVGSIAVPIIITLFILFIVIFS